MRRATVLRLPRRRSRDARAARKLLLRVAMRHETFACLLLLLGLPLSACPVPVNEFGEGDEEE